MRIIAFFLSVYSFGLSVILKIQVYGVLRPLYSIQNEAARSTRQQSQQNFGSLYLASKIFISSFSSFVLFCCFLPSLKLLDQRLDINILTIYSLSIRSR